MDGWVKNFATLGDDCLVLFVLLLLQLLFLLLLWLLLLLERLCGGVCSLS